MLKNKKVMAILMITILIGTNLIILGNKAVAVNLLEKNSQTNNANEPVIKIKELASTQTQKQTAEQNEEQNKISQTAEQNEEQNKISQIAEQNEEQGEISQTTEAQNEVSQISEAQTKQEESLQISLDMQNQTVIREGQIIRLTATIKNTSDTEVQNAKLKIIAPEGTKHTELSKGTLEYTQSNNKEKIVSLGNIKQGETITKDYELKIEKQNTNVAEKEIQNTVSILADNIEEIKSKNYDIKVLQGELQLVNIPTVSEDEILKQGKNITYKMKIENISNNKNLNNVTVKMQLPKGIKIKDVYYGNDNALQEKIRENVAISENTITANIGKLDSLYAYMDNNQQNSSNGPQIVKLRTNAYIAVECTVEEYTGALTAIATAKADGIEEHYSNVRIHTAQTVNLKITQKSLDKQNVKEGSQYSYHFEIQNIGETTSVENKMELELPEGLSHIETTYTYRGSKMTKTTIENGKVIINLYELNPQEKVEMQITVKANKLPNKEDKQITTVATLEAKGFSKIESNKISIMVQYDEKNHNQNNNNNNNNSNNDNNQNNNNQNPSGTDQNTKPNETQKFDLKLDTYITKITRTTPTAGTNIFHYNNSKIQKIEILKKNVNKSSIIVEYKIVVTNEGTIPGYAKKIVDYLPKNAKFVSEMNRDWYISNQDKNVYNISLANTLINPGESKEISLILSYNITDKDIGNTISNKAEIYESYNEKGLKDIDSIEGNQVEKEDDMSNADIILAVVTGNSVVIYTTITFVVIVLIAFGVFEIKRKVLNNRR